jgi:hypothetical protein
VLNTNFSTISVIISWHEQILKQRKFFSSTLKSKVDIEVEVQICCVPVYFRKWWLQKYENVIKLLWPKHVFIISLYIHDIKITRMWPDLMLQDISKGDQVRDVILVRFRHDFRLLYYKEKKFVYESLVVCFAKTRK